MHSALQLASCTVLYVDYSILIYYLFGSTPKLTEIVSPTIGYGIEKHHSQPSRINISQMVLLIIMLYIAILLWNSSYTIVAEGGFHIHRVASDYSAVM